MTLNTFNLPDVGEGLTEAEIVQWKVAPGATGSWTEVVVRAGAATRVAEVMEGPIGSSSVRALRC